MELEAYLERLHTGKLGTGLPPDTAPTGKLDHPMDIKALTLNELEMAVKQL